MADEIRTTDEPVLLRVSNAVGSILVEDTPVIVKVSNDTPRLIVNEEPIVLRQTERGDQGPQGPAGPPGPKGEQGDPGTFDNATWSLKSIYVSPDGSDSEGTGTQAKPYRTINFAVSQCPVYGTGTIYVYTGDYAETVNISAKHIVISAAAGSAAISFSSLTLWRFSQVEITRGIFTIGSITVSKNSTLWIKPGSSEDLEITIPNTTTGRISVYEGGRFIAWTQNSYAPRITINSNTTVNNKGAVLVYSGGYAYFENLTLTGYRGLRAYEGGVICCKTLTNSCTIPTITESGGRIHIAEQKQILYFMSQAVTPAEGAQIMRIPATGTDNRITTNTVVLACRFSIGANVEYLVNWTSYDGYITFTGTCTAATTASVILGQISN